MPHRQSLSAALSTALVLPALCALAGCHSGPAPDPSDSGTVAAAVPGATVANGKPVLVADAGRLVLPAVPGRPGAAYFTVRNEGTAPAKLVGVDIAGARSAAMHQTLGGEMKPLVGIEVAPGADVVFAPGGFHVMAMGLDSTLAAGGTARMTLRFADGETLEVPLAIGKMGMGADDMGHAMHE